MYSLPADSDSNKVRVEAISSTYYEKDIEAKDTSMSMNPMLDNANIRHDILPEESALSLSDECLSHTFSEVKDDACLQADVVALLAALEATEDFDPQSFRALLFLAGFGYGHLLWFLFRFVCCRRRSLCRCGASLIMVHDWGGCRSRVKT